MGRTERRVYGKRTAMRYFLLSFAAGFLVLSVTAMAVVLLIPPEMISGDGEGSEEYYFPSESETLNLLAVIASETEEQAGNTYVLIRFDPVRGRIPVAVFPEESLIGRDSQSFTLKSLYDYAGIRKVQTQLEEGFGISVDRCAALSWQDLTELVDLAGGTRVRLDEPLPLNQSGTLTALQPGYHQMSGSIFSEAVRYECQAGADGCREAAEMIAAFLNSRQDLALESEGEALFQKFCDLAETDLSMVDYQTRRAAMRFLSALKGAPAYAVPVSGSGETAYGTFSFSPDCCSEIGEIFSPPPAPVLSPE